jgi:uncharacterized protein YxjI
MQYLMSSKWALTERFEITDQTGTPIFEVHGNFGLHKEITFRTPSGQEVAKLKKHVLTNKYEVIVGGQHVAEVHHTGVFGQHFEIGTSQGNIDARGDFFGWNYTLSSSAGVIGTVTREVAFREQFMVDIADGQNDVFILATVLAIDNIHDERRGEQGMGGGMLGGGVLGGGLPGLGRFP